MIIESIVSIFVLNLSDYLCTDDVCVVNNNRSINYVVNFQESLIEIAYDFVDSFYRIKIEDRHNNQLQNTILLTQSKKFHNQIKKQLKSKKLSPKSFENHMLCFAELINIWLENNNLSISIAEYSSDLKFDGLFLN